MSVNRSGYYKWKNKKGKKNQLVSDMTRMRQNNILYEWTYMLETTREGDKTPYYQCLEDLKEKVEEQIDPVVLHTDQGSFYSSRAISEAHIDYNIIRSMSRVETPTDNPIIESINGWIKAEKRCDYTQAEKRPAYALGYLSPVQYRTKQGFP